MNNNQNALLTEKVHKLIIKYSLPAVLAMLITGIQGMIDGIFVGNFIDSNALASVNISSPFMQVIIGLSMIVSIGTQSHVSIKLGMNDEKQAKDTFQTFFRLISIFAILITVFGFFFSKEIATALGADKVLLQGTAVYIKTISLFALPMCLMFYFGFLNRTLGKPQLYFYGAIVSLFVNVSFNYFFLEHLKLGIMGAALATGIAYSSALLVVISPAINKKSLFNIFAGKFCKKSVLPVLYNGSSEGINSISTALTVFLFNTSLMSIAGADGVAAFTTINYIGTFGSLLLFGISDGVGAPVSYNFGAGEKSRVKGMMKIAYITNFILGMLIFLVLFFFSETLVGLFIKDNVELVKFAANGGKLYGIAFLLSGFSVLTSGYFTFIGKGLESVIVAASRGIIFVSIGIFVLPQFLDTNGIWLSVPFAEFMAFIISIFLLKKSSGKSKQNLCQPTEKFVNINDENKMVKLITINRQFGSGGREVGKRLSDALQSAYYDNELLSAIAKETGLSANFVDNFDEVPARNYRFTHSCSFASYQQPLIEQLQIAQTKILNEVATRGSAVIIGRCADYVLREYKPFKVFIYSSDMDFRVTRCFDKVPEDIQIKTHKEMENEILSIDKKRAKYYEYNTGQKWLDMSNYNLCIDISKIGVKRAVEIILSEISFESKEHTTHITKHRKLT